MAWQVGSVCYPSELAAATAAASSMGGAVVQQGSSAYVVGVGAVAPTSITYTFTPVDGGTALTLASAYTAQPCQMLDWSDGLQLGWLVAGIWLAVAGLLFLARSLYGGSQDDRRDA